MDAEQRATDATTRRLVAALVREGLATGAVDGDRLQVRLPGGVAACSLTGTADLRWLHPEDLGPVALDGVVVDDPRTLLQAADLDASKTRLRDLARALRSSVVHGTEVWAAPERTPRLEGRASAWDRAVRDGDPLDPCHWTRTGWTPRQTRELAPQCTTRIDVAFVALSGHDLQQAGEWPDTLARWLPRPVAGSERVVPVHPAALDAVRAAWPRARVLDEVRSCRTLGPLGRVAPDGVDVALQLAVPSGAQPTAAQVEAGVTLSVAARGLAPDGLGVIGDRGGIATDDGVLGVVVQDTPDAIWPGDRFVCAAAMEQRTRAGALVLAALPGSDRRAAFFSAWSGRVLDALLPLLECGLLPSVERGHWRGQWRQGRLLGVVVEGWWRARCHPPTLSRHHDGAPAGVAAVETLEELFVAAWQAWVAGHLGQLARALELGPDAFRTVRAHLDRIVPEGTPLHETWTGWTVPHRCALRSELAGQPVFRDLPNPLAT